MSEGIGCPSCGAATAEEDHAGITIDRCSRCHGVWFDHGELEQLHEHHPLEASRHGAALPLATTDLMCPRCHDHRLEKFGEEPTRVERCPFCGGVFVGSTSLEAIATRVRQPGYGIGEAAVEAAVHTTELSGDLLLGAFELIVELLGGVADLAP